MKRKWNWRVWAGFAIVLLAVFSYIPIFTRFAITRDFPWVNLLLFAVAGWLLATGLYRAFRRAAVYRGKVSGIILSALSLALFALFAYGALYEVRRVPPPENALRTGQRAPDFQLADAHRQPVTLAQLREGKRGVLLIFYRGYW